MNRTKVYWRMQQLFHGFGLSCLAGAVFLQVLVFVDIIQKGYFMAVENNKLIMSLEVFLAAFACIYFIHLCQKLIRSLLR
jgi:hypothetical protein